MSIYDNIRATFEVNLAAVTDVPEIAWENVTFTPTTDTPYLKSRMIPTVREPAVRGINPQIYYQGYFLVDCCVPEGLGPSAADTLADKIIDAFEATTDISHSGTIISIRYAERDLGYPQEAHFCVPVRIGWFIYS
jgi:hypothetical protein